MPLLAGKSVLFSTAVDAINTLAAAQAANRLKIELKKHLTLHCSSSMNLDTCPSTNWAPISSFKSSVSATNEAPLSLPPTEPLTNGQESSTTTPCSPQPSLIAFSITLKPWLLRIEGKKLSHEGSGG
jgi:hypothetical protein